MNEPGLQALVAELGDRSLPITTDVTQEADIEAMVALVVSAFGGLQVAFNVAGSSRLGFIADLAEEDWDFTVDICLKGVFLGMKHEARQMIRQATGGAIVNVASLNATVPMFGGIAYCASKAGVAMRGQAGALEFGEHAIRVNIVSPGLTDTQLARPLMDIQGVYESFMDHIPLA